MSNDPKAITQSRARAVFDKEWEQHLVGSWTGPEKERYWIFFLAGSSYGIERAQEIMKELKL